MAAFREILCLVFAAGPALSFIPGACAALDDPCDDRAVPPWGIPYHVRVLDNETGAPVEGVTVTARSQRVRFICCGPDTRCGAGDCHQEPGGQEINVTTGSDGLASACFTGYEECRYYEEGCYFTEDFTSFLAPEVPEEVEQGSFQDWIMTRWERGSNGVDQVVYVSSERYLASRFSPVLHRHAYELQQGLAGLTDPIRDPGTAIRAFDVGQGGRMVYERFGPENLHVLLWDCGQADSYGYGTYPQIKWQLDLADPLLHEGAPPGSRPLYYHVFPRPDGSVIVQYWMWFNGNDERQLPGPGSWHEGDWEWLAVQARWGASSWDAENVNFYQHEGGRTFAAADCWWSSSNEPAYYGMAAGYSPARCHVHAWLAANSHATYNRHQLLYQVSTPAGNYYDHVDYNIADNPCGDHAFVIYDALEPMGECETVHSAHGCTWIGHFTDACGTGDEMDNLAFTGTFGERHCPDGVPEVLCDFFYYGCRSPWQAQGSHEWHLFTVDYGGFGNGDSHISWERRQPAGCCLGYFLLSPQGNQGEVRFSVPSTADSPYAVATISSSTVRFMNEDSDRRIWLPLQSDHTYLFDERRANGEGPARIDVSEVPGGTVIAGDLRLEVGQPNSAGIAAAPGGGAARIRVAGAEQSGRPLRLSLRGAPKGVISWSVIDVAGRAVAGSSAQCSGDCDWTIGRPRTGGVYFLRVSLSDGETLKARFVVVQ